MSNSVKGFLAILFGTLAFGLVGVFSRLVGLEFGVFNSNWTRNAMVMVMIGIYLLFTKKWQRIEKQDKKWLVIWPLFGVFTTIGLFVGANRLPIGSALLFFFAGMILTNYLAAFLLFREKINLVKFASIALVLLGLLVIYGKSLNFGDALGFWASFLGGGGNGVWVVISKKLSKDYDYLQMIFVDALVSMLFSLTMAASLGERLRLVGFEVAWLVIFAWAVMSLGIMWSLIYGYKKMEAQKAALVMPMRAVFGAFWGWVIYKEALGAGVVVGGLMILLASILPNVVKNKA